MTVKSNYFDPMADAFFENEDLEYGLRVGLALKAGASYMPISYGEYIMPCVSAIAENGCSCFDYSNGFYTNKSTDWLDNSVDNNKALFHMMKFTAYTELAHSRAITDKAMQLERAGANWGGEWGGHGNPDFGKIVNIGTEGIRSIIEEKIRINPQSNQMYEGCLCVLDALDILGERFYNLAVKLHDECTDDIQKKRYETAIRAFSVIPQKPAYDFTSGCYAFWLAFSFDGYDSPGRFDQYMYGVFQKTDDKDEIKDVLGRLWDAMHTHRSWNLCLSGSDENWEDETNELTYEILKIAREKKYNTPNLTLRVHRNTSERLWKEIAETLASGIGMPALYNDEAVCVALEKIGILPCDSHDYCMNGCNQIDIMGKSHMGLEDGEVNFGKALEYTLHNGVNTFNNEKEGLSTGNPIDFKDYSEFENAFFSQVDYLTMHACMSANLMQHKRGAFSPNPFRSCLIEGCLEKGLDYRNGGPLYNHGQILAEGIADTGDSLWAVKKLVYDEKKYSMRELINALNNNFEGYDSLYKDFSCCEKFGNDIECVDSITARAINRFFATLKKHRTYRGGKFTGGCSTFSRASSYGMRTGALPNGRKKGDPLYADSIGAVPGCDKNGPTALLKSVLNFNHSEACSGFVLQAKFDKSLFNTQKGKESFIALAKAYFKSGGQQYTVNVISQSDLLDAKIHPEKHSNLIVRVGGYSDYFVNLSKELQDNVISRTITEL